MRAKLKGPDLNGCWSVEDDTGALILAADSYGVACAVEAAYNHPERVEPSEAYELAMRARAARQGQRRRRLECCCCGGVAPALAQWWNRDTGYGLCGRCARMIQARADYNAEEFTSCYGIEGVHWFREGSDASA